MYDPMVFSSVVIFCIFTMVWLYLTRPSVITPHQRETYRAHCILYLMEYYPGSTSESQCEAIRFSNIGAGQVEVDIELKSEIVCRHVAFILQVNDYIAGDMYVKKIDDLQVIEFKHPNLQSF